MILHYLQTGTEFIAAEVVAVRPHAFKRGGCTIVYADGVTISVRESPIEVMAMKEESS